MIDREPLKIAPGPPGNFLLGNLLEFRRDVLGLLTESARRYGDVVRCRLGPYVVHLINHPSHIEHVLLKHSENYDRRTRSAAKIRDACGDGLLTSNGELWRRQRRILQPAFQSHRLQIVTPVTTAATCQMLDRWDRIATTGQPIDVASEMKRLTCTIAARVFFGSNIGDDAAIIADSLETLLETTWSRLQSVVNLGRFPTASRRKFRKSLSQLDQIVHRIIAQRNGKNSEDDLLSMLLAACDEQTGERMPQNLLRDETITMLLAGHETTASSLARTFYLLSQFPAAQRRLDDEVADVLQGRVPTATDLPNLRVVTMLFQESLRLYPPIWIIERRAIRRDNIAGYEIPAGSSVVISPFALHRHPAFWEDPERFDPDRFSHERFANVAQHAYLPFGMGAHQCIGKDFAMIEGRSIIAQIAQRYCLSLVPGHPFVLMPGITLGLKHGLMMTLKRSELRGKIDSDRSLGAYLTPSPSMGEGPGR
jgi:cytochrome P450